MNRRHDALGFTLLELLVTITIAGVLGAIAVPSFRYVTTSNRLASESNSLLGDMQYARVEAIKEGQPVAVCAADPTDATGNTCAGGAPSWAAGWIVFSNPAGDGVLPPAAAPNPLILRKRPPFSANNSTDTYVSTAVEVIFNREGFAPGLAVSPTLFTLHDLANTAGLGRCLWLEQTGYLAVVASGFQTCL